MKKVILLVAGLIVLAGCIQLPFFQGEDLSSFRDCGQDEGCMLAAIGNCEKAFMRKVQVDEEGTLTTRFTVYGLEEDKCKMKYLFEKIEITASDEDKALVMQFIKSALEGQEITCVVPEGELQSIEEVDIEPILDYCSGPLIDVAKQMRSAMREAETSSR